jgi:hypothetical protein
MNLQCPACHNKLKYYLKDNNWKCKKKDCRHYNRYQFSAKVEEE